MHLRFVCALILLGFSGCQGMTAIVGGGGGGSAGGGSAGGSATGGGGAIEGTGGGTSSATCTACTTTTDCPTGATCVQYAGSDFCGHGCSKASDCGSGESCLLTVANDGTQAMVCVPTNGTCGSVGCGSCPSGSTCDPIAGSCSGAGGGGGSGATGGGGGSSTGGGSGTCNGYALPNTTSCCHSCSGGNTCQANGCYGGYWCNTSSCVCHAPLNTCGGTGGGSGGSGGGGSASGGGSGGGTSTGGGSAAGGGSGTGGGSGGGVGPSGGTVPHLYFAVVGDTRPSVEDDTSNYPTAIITKIYQDIAALNPQPQFVVATGDYQFAKPSGSQGATQLNLYSTARANYPGTVFPAMGNHECTGATATDCSTMTTNNLSAFTSTLLAPIHQTSLWYSFDVNDTAGQWTSKFIVTACNAWNSTQESWLKTELARSTTYTFVIRHEPLNSNGPCNSAMDPIITSSTYNGFLVGHTHTVSFNSSSKQLIEGVGGAPVTGSANYGYATIEQQTGGGFKVVQYDYQTNQAVNTYTLP